MRNSIEREVLRLGADRAAFVDISHLPSDLTRGHPRAVLIGVALPRKFVVEVAATPDYVERLVRSKNFSGDEYLQKEALADGIGDRAAGYISALGYRSVSQSEKCNEANGVYDEKSRSSPLPHKALALMAGWGWIGKNDLLVTEEYGCAICMCSVLTDAPFEVAPAAPPIASKCGNCRVCVSACLPGALSGTVWRAGVSRDEIVDVQRCTTCLKCLVLCPWTRRYAASDDHNYIVCK